LPKIEAVSNTTGSLIHRKMVNHGTLYLKKLKAFLVAFPSKKHMEYLVQTENVATKY